MPLILILLMQVVQAVLLWVFLKRMHRMEKRINSIIDEVKGYIQFVTEEEEKQEIKERVHLAEEQTQLLNAVLGEIFS